MAGWKIALSLLGITVLGTIITVLGTIILWISARIFRVAILMRGQSLNRRNLWTALCNAD